MIGLFLAGCLAALLIGAAAAVHANVAANPGTAGTGGSGQLDVKQVMLSGVLVLGPFTTLLILDN